MRAVVTPEDLKKGELVEPGWYPAEFADYEENPAEKDGSTNCTFHYRIMDGPAKGVTPRSFANEKALGFQKNLWNALGIPFDKVKGYEITTELLKSKIGQKVQLYIKRGKNKDSGKEFNEVADFRPIGG